MVKGFQGTSSLHCILAEGSILCAAEKSQESPTNETGELIFLQQSQQGLMLRLELVELAYGSPSFQNSAGLFLLQVLI